MVFNQVCCQFRDFVEIRETTQMIKFYLNCYQDFLDFGFCFCALMSFSFSFMFCSILFCFLFFLFGLISRLLDKKRKQWSKHKPRREKIFQIHNVSTLSLSLCESFYYLPFVFRFLILVSYSRAFRFIEFMRSKFGQS